MAHTSRASRLEKMKDEQTHTQVNELKSREEQSKCGRASGTWLQVQKVLRKCTCTQTTRKRRGRRIRLQLNYFNYSIHFRSHFLGMRVSTKKIFPPLRETRIFVRSESFADCGATEGLAVPVASFSQEGCQRTFSIFRAPDLTCGLTVIAGSHTNQNFVLFSVGEFVSIFLYRNSR